ncbi:MAG: UvrD-helicase domain-containing protein [bacterium]
MDILQNLNPKQIEAVTTVDGPILIIAGAGSGKTKTLTHRIAYLIKEKGVKPHNILAVTFTNKAAAEMRQRVAGLLGDQHKMPFVGTFHSTCVRILRVEYKNLGLPSGFLIYDTDDQLAVLKESIKEAGVSVDQFKPNSVLAAISSAKNKLQTPEDFLANTSGYFEEISVKCYEIYQNKLNKAGALDFDDLIMKTTLLFKQNAELLKKYQEFFKFVLVDEYQDTNHSQYMFTGMLADKYKNICVVGDDWQSIYKWRGADISNILEFERDYPNAKVILLEQNYRSSQNILDASYGVISKNVNRKDKKLFSDKDQGEAIQVVGVADEKAEGRFIVGKIKELTRIGAAHPLQLPLRDGERKCGCHPSEMGHTPSNSSSESHTSPSPSSERRGGLGYKDFAVLYRTNAQSRAIEEAFLTAGIPYRIVGGLKFYSRKEVKDILAYLRLILNPRDKVSIARVINVPARGIGQTTLEKLLKTLDLGAEEALAEIKSVDAINGSKQKAIDSFFKLIDKTREQFFSPPSGGELPVGLSHLIDFILKASGYDKYIQTDKDAEARWENIQELFTAVEKYNNRPVEEALKMFLEEVALVADTDEVDSDHNVVNLMTLHSSKGLEFNTVFIAGMEENILPHSRSTNGNAEEMEEERRLCYVGMTRAKERLFLIYAQIRRLYGNSVISVPSRFLRDIPDYLAEFQQKLDDFGDVIEVDEF